MNGEWLNIAKDIPDKVEGTACPKCGKKSIDFQYVGDITTRIGYLDIWCKSCMHGLHVSRVKIPENADIISFNASEEELTNRIPSFIRNI